MRKLFAMLFVALLVAVLSGCTQGQLAPAGVKDALYAARADAIVTAEKVRDGSLPPEDSLKALDRIGGTKAGAYDDGLLSPPYHWFRGTKPEEAGK